jgi:hypothetical protein
MNTLNFLRRVLPTHGFYVTTVVNTDGSRRQGFFTSIEELETAVTRLDKTGNNVYYAISSFKTKSNRKKENVELTKVLTVDIDCGPKKPYADWKAGLKALSTYVQAMDLPKPMVVFSGNGLHVYWILDTELTPDEWLPLAHALKASAIAQNFDVDAGLMANNALVLRPVGTHNHKNGKEVALLIDADTVPVNLFIDKLGYYMNAAPQVKTKVESSRLLQNLAVKTDFPPSNPVIVASKCKQIDWAINNADDVPEPVWYDLLGVAAYCKDSEQTAVEWSRGHSGFDANEAVTKMRRWRDTTTGPTTCDKFEGDRPNGCKGCKYKGKIGTPARLGVQYEEIPLKDVTLDSVANQVPMPKPFKRTAEGVKISIDDTDLDVCPFDIYPVSYGKDEDLGYEVVRFHWNRKHHGWQELKLRQSMLTAEKVKDFAGVVADQGIVLQHQKQTEYFQLMLRSYMNELRQLRAMTNLYSNMGWKENYKHFVLGDRLYRTDHGKVEVENITLASQAQRLGEELYAIKGTVEDWRDFTNLLDKADMPYHKFALGIGFASPLLAFTGLKGLTVSLYGPTGGGKTLIQLWQQSIYGPPEKLHFASKFTLNSLFHRLSMYNNLPMTIDEMTTMNDKDVGDFIYWVSQGKDKARLTRSAEERAPKEWATIVTISTNRSLMSKLYSAGLETDAQIARLFELNIPQHKLFAQSTDAGKRIYDFLSMNYGAVGDVYIRNLMELGEDAIRAMIAESHATFQQRYHVKFQGHERFWEQLVVLVDVALRLAKEWGLIAFDYESGVRVALEQVGSMKQAAENNRMDALDLVAEYLNAFADTAVTVMHTRGQKPAVDFSRIPRGDVRIRFDLYKNKPTDMFDRGTVLLDRTHLRKWLSKMGVDYKGFSDELRVEKADATPKSEKASLGKDTPIKLGQSYVVGVNLCHPRLQGVLDEVEQAVEDAVLNNIARIK